MIELLIGAAVGAAVGYFAARYGLTTVAEAAAADARAEAEGRLQALRDKLAEKCRQLAAADEKAGGSAILDGVVVDEWKRRAEKAEKHIEDSARAIDLGRQRIASLAKDSAKRKAARAERRATAPAAKPGPKPRAKGKRS